MRPRWHEAVQVRAGSGRGAPRADGGPSRGRALRWLSPRRLAGLAALLGALLALLLGIAAPASAHAALIRTDPADGSVVQTAPQRVVLTFSEGVLLSADSLRVLDPRGKDIAAAAPQHATGKDSGSTATVPLKGGLGNGTYTVAWRAISQDSHPVAGAFTFSIGAASKTSVDLSGAASAGDGTAGTLYGIGRYFAYAGFALLIGSAVFLTVCWPRGALLRPMRQLAAGGWATLVVSTIALIMLRGPYVDGHGLGEAVDLDVIRAQLETRPGAALISRLLLLAAAAVFLAVLFGSYAKREDPAERADLAWGLGIGGGVVAVGIAATWAMAEHASVGIQHQLAMPVDIVHLLSMAVWLGGLITLVTALSAPSTAGTVESAAVRRFSTMALTAVTTLICTGTYQAWRQIGFSWDGWVDTSYGRLLIIKIGLVASLVGVAWFSRKWTGALGEAGATQAVPGARSATVRQAVGASASGSASGSGSGSGSGGTATVEAEEQAGASAAGGTAVRGKGSGAGSGGSGGAGGAGGAAGSGDAAGSDAAGSDAAAGSAPSASGDPGRAAQLRRQQAARDTAQARRTRDADPARRALRRSVLAEVVVAAVLLSVTTLLTGSQPGRAAEEQKALKDAPAAPSAPASPGGAQQIILEVPYDTGGPGGKGTAEVTVAPGRVGGNETHLILTAPNGAAVNAPEAKLAFTLNAQHIGPIPVPLHRLVPGHWTAAGVQLPLAGTWQVSITVRTSDIDEVTVTKNVQVTQ